jgi:hypothetical protein
MNSQSHSSRFAHNLVGEKTQETHKIRTPMEPISRIHHFSAAC